MENEVHIFDDIIDLNYQEQIKTTLLENDFPWYYIHDVTNPYVNKQQRPGFQHNLVLEYGQENSPHHILFENLINSSFRFTFIISFIKTITFKLWLPC